MAPSSRSLAPFPFPQKTGRDLQFATAIVLTFFSVVLHGSFLLHHYGLWHDEVNSVAIATMPSLHELWASLSYDSSPALWPFLLRLWIFYGPGGSDLSVRLAGFLVQMLFLGALWFNARTIGKSVPVLSLFLLGCQPSIVLWPSLRSYSLGTALILFTLGSLWKVLEKPTSKHIAAALLLALLSVQCVYTNLILLAAICAGGVAVCLYRKQKRLAVMPCAVFLAAGLSLGIYVPTLHRIAPWQSITLVPVSFSDVFTTFTHTFITPIFFWPWMWLTFLTLFVAGTLGRILAQNTSTSSSDTVNDDVISSKAALIYGLTTTVLSSIAMCLFLQRAGRSLYAWHYLGAIGIFATCLDISWARGVQSQRVRSYVSVFTIVITLLLFPLVRSLAAVRRTNLDLVAARLTQMAKPHDLILIAPWQFAMTLRRYYHGNVAQMAVPDVGDLRLHRYDKIATLMLAPHSLQRVENAIVKTLQSGHRIWLVGGMPPAPESQPRFVLPKDYGPGGWNALRYEKYCAVEVAYFLKQRATSRTSVPVEVHENLNEFEFSGLEVVQGWKGDTTSPPRLP